MRTRLALGVLFALGAMTCGGDLDEAPTAPVAVGEGRDDGGGLDDGEPYDTPDAGTDASEGGGLQPVTLTNPVFHKSFPDPFVLKVGDTWHAYATSAMGKHIPHLTSNDLQTWTLQGDALPTINGQWIDTDAPRTWAPSVARISATRYVLYYAPHVKNTPGRHCLGRAVADNPAGPFVDDFAGPLYCDTTPGHGYWSLDPSPFRDEDGALYLLWRQDDGDSNVAVRRLRPNGAAFAAASTVQILFSHTPGSWEDGPADFGKLIENPAMIRDGAGRYDVFYSGNTWQKASYATGYAVCTSPTGPCVKKTTKAPWLASAGSMKGPGGLDFFEGPGAEPWVAWHAWTGAVGPGVGTRELYLGTFRIDAKGPHIGAPVVME